MSLHVFAKQVQTMMAVAVVSIKDEWLIIYRNYIKFINNIKYRINIKYGNNFKYKNHIKYRNYIKFTNHIKYRNYIQYRNDRIVNITKELVKIY